MIISYLLRTFHFFILQLQLAIFLALSVFFAWVINARERFSLALATELVFLEDMGTTFVKQGLIS